MSAAVLLINPKFPHNVGAALRAAACFDAGHLCWTGDRVPAPEKWPEGARLPREERIKAYKKVQMWREPHYIDAMAHLVEGGFTPVAVEVRDNSEDLRDFIHTEKAVYIFGPEDGNVPKGALHSCHRFVRIPTEGCLNLAAAVNIVLYDRLLKEAYPLIERVLEGKV